jgi:hypothetical protein
LKSIQPTLMVLMIPILEQPRSSAKKIRASRGLPFDSYLLPNSIWTSQSTATQWQMISIK